MTNPPPPTVRSTEVTRELLVRQLQVWAPAALQRARRVTYAHGYADSDGGATAEAALRALAGAAGSSRGRELVMIATAADSAPVRRLDAVQRERPDAVGLAIHVVPGDTDARLGVGLRAAGAARTPVFGFLDAGAERVPPALTTVAALMTGRPVEMLLVLAPSLLSRLAAAAAPERPATDPVDGDRFFGDARWRTAAGVPAAQRRAYLIGCYRAALNGAGFPLVSAVELGAQGDAEGELLVFATTSGRSLEVFKETLWAVSTDVRFREPGDPAPAHSDSLRPKLLARLASAGRCTVTELRTFTLTDTVYRAGDATRVLNDLLAAGLLVRDPEHGRLGGDVVVALAEPAVGESMRQ